MNIDGLVLHFTNRKIGLAFLKIPLRTNVLYGVPPFRSSVHAQRHSIESIGPYGHEILAMANLSSHKQKLFNNGFSYNT